MNNEGIKFLPLYWIYHDCWINRAWGWDPEKGGWNSSESYRRMGHIHFFMNGYTIGGNGKAYSGTQKYDFSLESIWGPESGDPNQSNDVKYIGTPKWYFTVKEYWRRVYVQQWEDQRTLGETNFLLKRGIKYDASRPIHTLGPFREGQGFFLYWNRSARTLPIEYYLDGEKKTRNNFLWGTQPWQFLRNPSNTNELWSIYSNSFSDSLSIELKEDYNWKDFQTPFYIPYGEYIDRPIEYLMGINKPNASKYIFTERRPERWANVLNEIGGTIVSNSHSRSIKYCDLGYHSYSNSYDDYRTPRGAFNVGCGDYRYIYPIIEYQAVTHLDNERYPGWETRVNGDGFSFTVELPYKVNGEILSPFSDRDGVKPMGEYCHDYDVKHPDKIPKFSYCDWVDMDLDSRNKPDITWNPNMQYVVATGTQENPLLSRVIYSYSKLTDNEFYPDRYPIGKEDYDDSKLRIKNGMIVDNFDRPILSGRKRCVIEDGDIVEISNSISITTNKDLGLNRGIYDEEYRIPEQWKDKPCKFNVPDGLTEDGQWVEQCFGGIVKAKAVVTIEDSFGARRDVEVTTTRFFLSEQYEGSDQYSSDNGVVS